MLDEDAVPITKNSLDKEGTQRGGCELKSRELNIRRQLDCRKTLRNRLNIVALKPQKLPEMKF